MDVLDVDELVKICVSNEQKAADLLARISRGQPQPKVSIKREAPEELSPNRTSDSFFKPRPRICKKGKKVRNAKLGSLSEPGSSSPEPEAQARDTSVEWLRLLPSWRRRALRYKRVPDAPGGDAPPPPPPLLRLGGEQVDANANLPAVAPPLPPPPLPLIGVEAIDHADPLPVVPSAEHNVRPRNALQLDLNQLPPPENEVPAAAEAAFGPPHTDHLPEPSAPPTEASVEHNAPPSSSSSTPRTSSQNEVFPAAAEAHTDPLQAASAPPAEPKPIKIA